MPAQKPAKLCAKICARNALVFLALAAVMSGIAPISMAESDELTTARRRHDVMLKLAKAAYDAAIRKAKLALIDGLEAEMAEATAAGDLDRALRAREQVAAARIAIIEHTPPAPADAGALRFPIAGRWMEFEKSARVYANRPFRFADNPPPALRGMRFWHTNDHPAQFVAVRETRVILLIPSAMPRTVRVAKQLGFRELQTPMLKARLTVRGPSDPGALWEKTLRAGEKVSLPAAAIVIAK